MAYLAENPKLQNTGIQGMDIVLRTLTSLFGPRAQEQMDPHALYKHPAYDLAHSFLRKTDFMTTTFIEAMDSVPDWWQTVTGAARESNGIHFAIPITVQKKVVAQPTAAGAPADISEQTEELRNYSLHRVQTDFIFRNERFQFGGEQAMHEVTSKLGAVKAAIEIAYQRHLVEMLMAEKDFYQDFKARYGMRSVRTVEDAIRWYQDSTFAIQKGGLRAWAELWGKIRDAIKEAGFEEPNICLVCKNVKLITSIQSYDAVEYYRRGNLIFPHLEKLDKSLDVFHGVRIIEVPPVSVENEQEPIDPLRVVMRTGNYFTMPALPRNCNLKNYCTGQRSVLVYDRSTDDEKTEVSLQKAFQNIEMWDADGFLSGDLYQLAANVRQNLMKMGYAVPEDPNETIQPHMFIYRHESGDYRVADIFGHMEQFYLDVNDLREMVETGYNSFDKVLTEADKRALLLGLERLTDLFMYDVNSEPARAFRLALELSNTGANGTLNADSNTGLVNPGLWGFAANLPIIETNENGMYVLRAANIGTENGGAYITRATDGTLVGGELANAITQSVPFRPYGMGSISGMFTLAELARSPAGSAGRLGYDDKLLDEAREFMVAVMKIYNEMVSHFGEDHISLNPERLPEFFKGPVPLNNSILMFASQHLDTPKYPFFQPNGVGVSLSPAEDTIRGRLQQEVDSMSNIEAASFLRSFLANDQAFGLFISKIEELYKHPFEEWFERLTSGKSPAAIAKALNTVVNKLKQHGVSCVGVTDGAHVSLRLVASANEFFKEETWGTEARPGLRPRSVVCPHGIFTDGFGAGDITAFRNSERNSQNVSAGDVLGSYVVNEDAQPYMPDMDSMGPIRGSHLDDMDFDLFDGRMASGTVEDKSYNGATSSNLERKYREISNRYISLPVHRAYGQMVLLSPTTRQQFQRFMENDTVVPAEVMVMKPEIEYEAYTFFWLRGAGETVSLYRFASNFTFENRGIARETAGSFAQHMGIIPTKQNYTMVNAAWCSRYRRGEGLDPLTVNNMNVRGGDFGGSALYILMPYRACEGRPGLQTKVQAVQFLTGQLLETYWNAQVADDLVRAGYKWGTETYPGSAYTSWLHDLWGIAAQMRINEQTHLPSDPAPTNILCLRTQSYNWNQGSGDYTTKIQNQDVFGKDGVYTGCGRDRDGNMFRNAHAKDNSIC